MLGPKGHTQGLSFLPDFFFKHFIFIIKNNFFNDLMDLIQEAEICRKFQRHLMVKKVLSHSVSRYLMLCRFIASYLTSYERLFRTCYQIRILMSLHIFVIVWMFTFTCLYFYLSACSNTFNKMNYYMPKWISNSLFCTSNQEIAKRISNK